MSQPRAAHAPGLRALAAAGVVALLVACGSQSPAGHAGASGLSGDFISGVVSRAQTWVALSTDGHRVLAFACDGSPEHAPTFAEWFSGTSGNGIVDLRSSDGARLVSSLTARSTTGRVSLPDGIEVDFTLTPVESRGQAGLFRSEQTIGGVPYLGGWVLPPRAPTSPSSSPRATAPSAGPPRRRGPTPSAAPALPAQGGAIIDQQNRALLPPPTLDARALAARQVAVPKVGTLNVTYCVRARCE
jgi:hypothetical protein